MEPPNPGARIVHMTPDPACPEADQMLSDICRRVLRLQSHCLKAGNQEALGTGRPGPAAPRASRGFGVELAEEANEFGPVNVHCAVDAPSPYYQSSGFAVDEASRREMNTTVQHYLYKLNQMEKKPNKYHARIRNWFSKWIPTTKTKGCSCSQKDGVPGNVMVSETPAVDGGKMSSVQVDVHLNPPPKSTNATSLHKGVSILSRKSSEGMQIRGNTITNRQSNENISQQRYQIIAEDTKENEISNSQEEGTGVVPANELESTRSHTSKRVTLKPVQEEGKQTIATRQSNVKDSRQTVQVTAGGTGSNGSNDSQIVIIEAFPENKSESSTSQTAKLATTKPVQQEERQTILSRKSNVNDSMQRDQLTGKGSHSNETSHSQVVITEVFPANEPESPTSRTSKEVIIKPVNGEDRPSIVTRKSNFNDSQQKKKVTAEDIMANESRNSQVVVSEVVSSNDRGSTHSRESKRISLKPVQEEVIQAVISGPSNLNAFQQRNQVTAEGTHSNESPNSAVVIAEVVPVNEVERKSSRTSKSISLKPVQEDKGQLTVEEVTDGVDSDVTHEPRTANNKQ